MDLEQVSRQLQINILHGCMLWDFVSYYVDGHRECSWICNHVWIFITNMLDHCYKIVFQGPESSRRDIGILNLNDNIVVQFDAADASRLTTGVIQEQNT
jgi:hypothetical protein